MTETDRHTRVENRAKALWEQFGCPHGRDEEIWIQAEQEILAEDQAVTGESLGEGEEATESLAAGVTIEPTDAEAETGATTAIAAVEATEIAAVETSPEEAPATSSDASSESAPVVEAVSQTVDVLPSDVPPATADSAPSIPEATETPEAANTPAETTAAAPPADETTVQTSPEGESRKKKGLFGWLFGG